MPLDSYDIGISFMHLHRVPAEHVNNKKWFNFHPGLLPKYKGRNLCYHAIMNDEKVFGATLHMMDENFDTGDIVSTAVFPILPHQTAQDVSEATVYASRWLFEKYLPRILDNEEFLLTPNAGGTYYKKEPISEFIELDDATKRKIRAITYGNFYPVVDIGGVIYKIVEAK